MPEELHRSGLLDESESSQQTIKVCVLGKGGSGKSPVIRMLTHGPNCVPSQTQGLQVTSFRWPASQQQKPGQASPIPSTFEFWEVGAAAASKDPSLLMAAKHSLAVALLVFSMTERAGFNQLPDYLAELDSRRCILVATRADHVQSGAVTMAEVQTLAEMHGLPVYLVGFAAGLTGNMAMVGGPRDHSSVESAVLSKILKIVDDNLW